MTFLKALINNVADEFVKEQFQDRLDIVRHKIKFMDKVAVAVLDTHNQQNRILDPLLDLAGGAVVDDPAAARVLIYLEQDSNMLNLMGMVPAMLEREWPAVTYNRLYLLDDLKGEVTDPAYALDLLEDLAEMLNPGTFVFGSEGRSWMSFGV